MSIVADGEADRQARGERVTGARAAAFIAVLVAVGFGCWLARWSTAPTHASGDTFWYTRQALQIAGSSRLAATALAARYVVDQGRGQSAESWIRTAEAIDPRYPAIFESRPIYPLVAAPFVWLLGPDAMVAAALLAGLVFAVALGCAVLFVTGSRLAAVVSVILAYVLPSGGWIAFLYADGWMLALWTAALGLAVGFLASGRRRWMIAYGLVLLVLQETKSASGVVLIVGISGTAVVSQLVQAIERRRLGQLAVVGALIVVVQLAVGSIVGAPGLDVTLQDYFTHHFSVPDVPDPLRMLLRRDASLLPRAVIDALAQPLPIVAVAAGMLGLAWLRSMTGFLLIAAAAATTLIVLVHPAPSEFPRLLAPVWVSVAAGAGVAIAAGRSRIEALRPPGRMQPPPVA